MHLLLVFCSTSCKLIDLRPASELRELLFHRLTEQNLVYSVQPVALRNTQKQPQLYLKDLESLQKGVGQRGWFIFKKIKKLFLTFVQ